jgi:hypothetical protein
MCAPACAAWNNRSDRIPQPNFGRTQLLATEVLVMAGAGAVVPWITNAVIYYYTATAKATRRQGDARTRMPRRNETATSLSIQYPAALRNE